MAISFILSFFIAPFVVHHLGNTAYGVWVMVASLMSYMGLLDLGLRGAVTRFVSRDYSQGNHSQASRVVSAALALRVIVGLVIIFVSALLADVGSKFLRIPPDMLQATRSVILLTGVSLAVTLVCGVFGGVLAALGRFDLLSSVTVIQSLCRAGGVVWLLKSGHGIVALAVWELIVALLANAAIVTLSFLLYSNLRILVKLPDRDILRSIWGYSFFIFVINSSVQIIYYTDNLVVGAFISASAVALYAVGGSLIEYLRQVVSSLTTVFMPMASGFEAQGERGSLRSLLVRGTQAAILVALPIEVALLFRGPTFIGLWMGSEYAGPSGRVLQILVFSQIFAVANYASGNIAYGLGKHRRIARWATGEAIANLGLSIVLVQRLGLNGVALGTALPNLVTGIVLWPRYISKILEIPLSHYLWHSWVRPALATVPFALACYLAERFWPAPRLSLFFVQIVTLLPFFIIGVLCVFRHDVWPQLKRLGKGLTATLSRSR